MSGSVGARRLAALGVTCPEGTPAAAVARCLAIQSQDPEAALWAIGLRCGADRASVVSAFAERSLVRTWPMRGTLHTLCADDARWVVELLAMRAFAAAAGRRRELGLDDETLARCRAKIEERLAGGVAAGRDDLYAEIASLGIPPGEQRGYHVLVALCQQGVLCAVDAARVSSFALLDQWLPNAPRKPRDESLALLARRYFAGHGPATEQDLAWWSGLGLREVRAALALAGDLTREERGSSTLYSWGEVPPGGVEPSVHLLPAFDELLLGYRDRGAVLDPAHASRVCPGGNGVFRPILVVGGRVAATWRSEARAGGRVFTFEPFAGSVPPRLAHAAAERFAAFLGETCAALPAPPWFFDGDEQQNPRTTFPCLSCGEPVPLEVHSFLRHARTQRDITTEELVTFDLSRGTVGSGSAQMTVTSTSIGLTPYLGPWPCPSCDRTHTVALAYGEWQPGRTVAALWGVG
ncbi:MAG: winged helix DNA-binding domain-containing protein [Myxococcota bacterium]